MFEHLLQSNAGLQLSLDSYRGQISVYAPSHKLFNEEFHLIPREKRSRRPLKALTVFTDASGASHKSVMTWRNPHTQHWEADVEFVEGSPQVAELAAVVRAFEKFSEPINLVTDSAYVAEVVSRAEQAVLKDIKNEQLFRFLSKLIYLISHREHPFYVMHVRSHTNLAGEIAEAFPELCLWAVSNSWGITFKAFDDMDVETNDDEIKCLWVRIKGNANKADILLGVCYRPPNNEEEVDNLFFSQLENVSGSSGDFNLSDIFWELNTAEKRQSKKVLEYVGDNFLSQLEEAVRKLLISLYVHKSMGPDGIHPRAMRELADELAKQLAIIYQ
ncbi:hypothetical protein TURU_124700 [Turdus rufiventris]|nr:hypothetical protein TURU_124700 [Turdus rufiventris]